jgi:uncharacterized membrane protein
MKNINGLIRFTLNILLNDKNTIICQRDWIVKNDAPTEDNYAMSTDILYDYLTATNNNNKFTDNRDIEYLVSYEYLGDKHCYTFKTKDAKYINIKPVLNDIKDALNINEKLKIENYEYK